MVDCGTQDPFLPVVKKHFEVMRNAQQLSRCTTDQSSGTTNRFRAKRANTEKWYEFSCTARTNGDFC
jgi:hypothetical protein